MKNLQNLGKALSKAEQQTINGGSRSYCCEWCSDGPEGSYCLDWSSGITCPFSTGC